VFLVRLSACSFRGGQSPLEISARLFFVANLRTESRLAGRGYTGFRLGGSVTYGF